MRLKSIVAVIFLTLFLTLFTLHAHAQQQPFNITTSPNAFDISSEPGKTIKQTFKIRNNGDSPLPLKIEVKKLIPTEDGQITIKDFTKEEDYQHWIKVDNASLSAQPKEWTFIPVTITIPKTAAFGYYWVLVLSPREQTTADKNAQAHLTGAVAIPVLLSVHKDGMKSDGHIASFTPSSSWYDYLPVTFTTTFANTGNVHSKPRGNIFITDWRGKQVAVLDINKEQGNVLPSAKRAFTTVWDDSFITMEDKMEDGKAILGSDGKPEKKWTMHFDKLLNLRIGQYRATALVVVSGDKRDYSFESTTTFFVFPWHIIIGGLLVSIFALVGIFSTIKSLGRKIKTLFKR